MPMSSGLSGLIRLAAALELDPEAALETIFIGAPRNSPAGNFEWQGCGNFLLYSVELAQGEIRVSAALLDVIAEPQFLLKAPDTEEGWRLVFHFICSLERYRVATLVKPIRVGDPLFNDPSTCWIIAS